jgi:pseudouridine-5'-phosphate glycosidase
VDEPDRVAAVLLAGDRLRLGTGAVVVANPVPADRQLDPAVHDRVLADALAAAERDGVRGAALTPYLLDRLHRGTGGASLAANIALVLANAALAGRIAVALADAGTVTAGHQDTPAVRADTDVAPARPGNIAAQG